MRGRIRIPLTILAAAMMSVLPACAWAAADDWCANHVVSYQNVGVSPFDDPGSVLGRPTTWNVESAVWSDVTPGNYAVSLTYAASTNSPDGAKLVLTLNKAKTSVPTQPAGSVVVRFAKPIYDDPLNWYGKDFIVFGNSRFNSSDGLVDIDTDMEAYRVAATASGFWEQMKVSVSQDGETWFDYSSGPFADDFAPTQAFAWDRQNHTWGAEMDYTKPVPTSLTKTSFAGLTVADGIDLYKGSAGGTAFDISEFSLQPDPATGLKWIQYVKVSSMASSSSLQADGEVDAFTRVSAAPQENGPVLSGTVTFGGLGSSSARPTETIFEFRRTNGVPFCRRKVLLGQDGSFRIRAYSREYDLVISKHPWLSKSVRVNATGGDVTGLAINLTNGDVDADNSLTTSDISVLLLNLNAEGD